MLGLVPIPDLIGSTLADRYEILSKIGSGGMSIIYKARDKVLDRVVAVKVLQSQLVDDEISMKRFQQEAQAASHLGHPNVIDIHDFDVSVTGQPYLVMDFLSGESLSDIVKREGHVDFRRLIPIFMQTCDALEHAHNKGVIHRDLKSSNVMLSESDGSADIVTVVDFGIAKLMPSSGKQPQNLTNTGEIFGSPIYMSPEQCLGQVLDSRSDIYSLGTMMYETLSGFPPLMGDTIIDTMKMHVNNKPRPFKEVCPQLMIPSGLEAIVFKALEKSPNARFQTMRECYEALEHFATLLASNDATGERSETKKSSGQRISLRNSSRSSAPADVPKGKIDAKIENKAAKPDLPNAQPPPRANSPFPVPRKLPSSGNLRKLSKSSYLVPTKLTVILLVVILLAICIAYFKFADHH